MVTPTCHSAVSGKLRFPMTVEKTAQLVGNIEVVDGTPTPNNHGDCAWVWRATQEEALALMVASKATAQGSKEAFDGGRAPAKGTLDTAGPGQKKYWARP